MVIDASVILKWFMEEDGSNKAKDIKNAHISGASTITIPDIALYEVGNALRYKLEFSAKEVNRCFEELYELNLDIIGPYPEIVFLVTEIARQNDITFYDAFYVALAKELGLQFITADERLYNRTRNLHFINLL
ncbi:MAG: type II toxin-antitoxin system VapC family toxin [Thermodesulfovibrionales bacterium]|nr:type II toxin-antitoxin system VapC family toxin [Thermodesulfovibrionales bacterium]